MALWSFFDGQLPDEEYTTPETVKTKVPKNVRNWGESKNGLRICAVANPDSVKLGEFIPFKVVVENTSDRSIKFSLSELLNKSPQAEVRRTNGNQVETLQSAFQIDQGLPGFPVPPRVTCFGQASALLWRNRV